MYPKSHFLEKMSGSWCACYPYIVYNLCPKRGARAPPGRYASWPLPVPHVSNVTVAATWQVSPHHEATRVLVIRPMSKRPMSKRNIVPASAAGRAPTNTRTLSSTNTAIQVELKCAGCTKIKVARVDGVELFQARHRLVLNPDAAKDLAESRSPQDWEATFVVDHVNEQLRRGVSENVDKQRIQELLNSAVVALHAALAQAASHSGVLTPANTATSPLHRRAAACAVAFIDLGDRGKIYARSNDWKWVYSAWIADLHCCYPTWAGAPTEEEFSHVRALLLQLLATKAARYIIETLP